MGSSGRRSGSSSGSSVTARPRRSAAARQIASVVRAPAGRCEMAAGSRGEVAAAVRLRPQLDETGVRLLEVVADDLLELLVTTVEPAGEALVEVGALRFRDPVVGGVANEHVAEAEGVVDRLVGTDQLLAHERRQPRSRWTPAVGCELAERLPLEVEPDDGRSLDDLPLLLGQRVEPGGEQRLDRRGHLVGSRRRRRASRAVARRTAGSPPRLRGCASASGRRAWRSPAGSRSARRTPRPSAARA